MPFPISSLPSELCVAISHFLNYEDWSNFLNSGKSVEHIKRETRYILLNFSASQKYCSDEIFRDAINFKIKDRRRQLCLSLHNCTEDELLSHTHGVHRLVLSHCNLPSIKGFVQNISELTLLYCEQLTQILDSATESSLKKVDIFMCQAVQDFSQFSSLHSIRIVDNKELRDLSALRNIKNVKLVYCTELRDLTGLAGGHVQSIAIVGCQYIEDLSPLQHCQSVEINGCHNVKNIMPLIEVSHVSIEYCREFNDSNQIAAFQQRQHKTFHYLPFKDN